MKTKIKVNSIFFLFLSIAPVVGILAPILFSPLAFNKYSSEFESLLGVNYSLVLPFIEATLFATILVGIVLMYIGIPYLISIKEDGISFYRLFRRKIYIKLINVYKIDILKKIPSKPHDSSNILFHLKGGEKIAIVAISNSISDEIAAAAEKKDIPVYKEMRRLTEDEWKPLKL